MRRHYFAKISLVDRQIARVVQALEHKGLLQNSLFLFCSDHGELLGEHGMAYKWLMYDDIVRVPFLAVPGPDFQGVLPRDCDDLVSLIDIGPTFLEAAGLEIPRRLEGRSLLGLLRGQPPQEPREMVFCEDNYLLMARTKTHKLVLYLGQEFGEFYDLTADPGETTNLWESPDYSELKNHFKLAALEWVASSVYLYAGSKCHQPDLIPRWPQAGPPTLHGPVFPHSIQP
jgi:arylsulfatase A-like enzyme